MFRSTGKQSGESVDSVLKRSLVWHYLSRNLTRAYRANKRLRTDLKQSVLLVGFRVEQKHDTASRPR